MPENLTDLALPTSMPVLSRGKHSNPSRGACFMEYTSVLAGESFSDAPRCVDPELASVLRSVNDNIPNAERGRLVPLLGRAIGLAVERPPGRKGLHKGLRRSSAERRLRRQAMGIYALRTAQLRRGVTGRFVAAVGCAPSEATRVWRGWEEEVCWLFWDLMGKPTRVDGTDQHAERLVERLVLLHECYEQTMRELGLPRLAVLERRAEVGVTLPRA
jgi:hypothetical protein